MSTMCTQVKVDLTPGAIAALDFSKELQFRLKAIGRNGLPWTDNGDNPNSVDFFDGTKAGVCVCMEGLTVIPPQHRPSVSVVAD